MAANVKAAAALMALASAMPEVSGVYTGLNYGTNYGPGAATYLPGMNFPTTRMEGRFLPLTTNPPAGGSLSLPNLTGTPFINNFTIDVTVPLDAYMVPPNFNGTGTKPCPEPCAYPNIQNATQADVDRWYWSWYTNSSVHVPHGYYHTGYDKWCNSDNYRNQLYGNSSAQGCPLNSFPNKTFVRDWYGFYGQDDVTCSISGMCNGNNSVLSTAYSNDAQSLNAAGGFVSLGYQKWFTTGMDPYFRYQDSTMPVPKYRLAYYRAFNTLVRNMTVWNSAENPRCAPMPAIHYGPKLFCLQGGTGNGYTDTQPLCNLRNVTLLGPGQLRLTFFDKAPVLFNSTLTGNQPYWDPYQALKNPVTYNATGRVFVNFTASTWYDNSTGFDQRYDFYQDKIVALMPGGDAHNWARNKYRGTPGNRDTFGQILAAPAKLWTRGAPKWTHVAAPWFRLNNAPATSPVRPAWSFACAMRLDTDVPAGVNSDRRCLVPSPLSNYPQYNTQVYVSWVNPNFWNYDGVFWINKTQFVTPPTPYTPSGNVFDFVPNVRDSTTWSPKGMDNSILGTLSVPASPYTMAYDPATKELSWTLVINGTGEVEYNLWNRAISVQYPNGTVANNMYHRHPLKRINLKFTDPMLAYPLKKLGRVYHALEMYDVRTVPQCAPRQPNNLGGNALGGSTGGNTIDDFDLFTSYITMVDCVNTRGELYTEEVENQENVQAMLTAGTIARNATIESLWVWAGTPDAAGMNANWPNATYVQTVMRYAVFQGPNYRLVWDSSSKYAVPTWSNPSTTGAWYRQYGGVVKSGTTYGDASTNFKEDISCPWFSVRENSDDFSFPGKRSYLHWDRSLAWDVYQVDSSYPLLNASNPEDTVLGPIPHKEKFLALFSYNASWVHYMACNATASNGYDHWNWIIQSNNNRSWAGAGGWGYGPLALAYGSGIDDQTYSSEAYDMRMQTMFTRASTAMFLKVFTPENGTGAALPGADGQTWGGPPTNYQYDQEICGGVPTFQALANGTQWELLSTSSPIRFNQTEQNVPIDVDLKGKWIRGMADVPTGLDRSGPTGFRYKIDWVVLSDQWYHPAYNATQWLILQAKVGTTGKMVADDLPPMFMPASANHAQCGGLWLTDLMNTTCDSARDTCLESIPTYFRRQSSSYLPFGTTASLADGAVNGNQWSPVMPGSPDGNHRWTPRYRAEVIENVYNSYGCYGNGLPDYGILDRNWTANGQPGSTLWGGDNYNTSWPFNTNRPDAAPKDFQNMTQSGVITQAQLRGLGGMRSRWHQSMYLLGYNLDCSSPWYNNPGGVLPASCEGEMNQTQTNVVNRWPNTQAWIDTRNLLANGTSVNLAPGTSYAPLLSYWSPFLQLYFPEYANYWDPYTGADAIYGNLSYPYWDTSAVPAQPVWANVTVPVGASVDQTNAAQRLGYIPSGYVWNGVTNYTQDLANGPISGDYIDNWPFMTNYYSFVKGGLALKAWDSANAQPPVWRQNAPWATLGMNSAPTPKIWFQSFYFKDYNNTNAAPANWATIGNGTTWDNCQSRPFLQLETRALVQWTVTVVMHNATVASTPTADWLNPWN